MGERLRNREAEAICERVYRRFPEMQGVRPSIQRQQAQGQDRFLLRFQTVVPLEDGARLPSIVRVVATADGKILKMTSSR
jgi:hypothetical protein